MTNPDDELISNPLPPRNPGAHTHVTLFNGPRSTLGSTVPVGVYIMERVGT